MASRVAPRSVKDATRFTSTIPHAASKAPGAGAAARATQKIQSRIPGETPEQRVKRLRMAHLAAQQAQISKTDRFIDASRRFFDVAHRWTIRGIVLFTAVATVVSIYSVWDMLRYNRSRREEWKAAQKAYEDDALAAARIAYLKGTATEEQVLLVEEANAEAAKKGVKLPPLLAPPEHRTHFEETIKPTFEEKDGRGVWGAVTGLFGKKEEKVEASVVEKVEETARQAWDQELENQRRGGMLDQMGSQPEPKKKGWWP